MPVKNLTAKSVAALKPLGGQQVDYWDRSLTGFGIRVAPSGRKTWTVMYRHLGRLRRMSLGTYPRLSLADAREAADDRLHEAGKGKDPAAAKVADRQGKTFSDLATDYIEKYAMKRKRSWKEDYRLLYGSPHKRKTGKRPYKALTKTWGNRRLVEIQRRDVRDLLEAIAVTAPITANRIRSLLHKMFNFAIEHEWLDANPCHLVKAPATEVHRDRVLTHEEIQKLWNATDDQHETVRAYFRVRLLTAQRGGEVLAMRWDDVDLTSGWWTIPAERSKNGLAHRVPLSRPVLDILKGLKKTADKREIPSPWVFQSTRSREPKQMEHAQKAVERVRTAVGSDFRGHDLRRTAASLMVGAGTPRLVVSKILNHVEQGVTAVYDRHSYDAEKKAALDRWAVLMKEIVSGKKRKGKVLAFTG